LQIHKFYRNEDDFVHINKVNRNEDDPVHVNKIQDDVPIFALSQIEPS